MKNKIELNNELKSIIESINNEYICHFNEIINYIKSFSYLVSEMPRLAFISINKDDQIFSPHELQLMYKQKKIRLGCSHNDVWGQGKMIYLNCNNSKLEYENNIEIEPIILVKTFYSRPFVFDIKFIYDKLYSLSQSKLCDSCFEKTKSQRRDEKVTAINYVEYVIRKAKSNNFNLTFDDLIKHFAGNELLLKYIVSEKQYEEIKLKVKADDAIKVLGK